MAEDYQPIRALMKSKREGNTNPEGDLARFMKMRDEQRSARIAAGVDNLRNGSICIRSKDKEDFPKNPAVARQLTKELNELIQDPNKTSGELDEESFDIEEARLYNWGTYPTYGEPGRNLSGKIPFAPGDDSIGVMVDAYDRTIENLDTAARAKEGIAGLSDQQKSR